MCLQLKEMPLRRKKVESYELKIHSLMLDNTCKYSLIQIERSDQAQVGADAHPQRSFHVNKCAAFFYFFI